MAPTGLRTFHHIQALHYGPDGRIAMLEVACSSQYLITGKAVEIVWSDDSAELKKCRVSPFLVCWQPFEHRDPTNVHG